MKVTEEIRGFKSEGISAEGVAELRGAARPALQLRWRLQRSAEDGA